MSIEAEINEEVNGYAVNDQQEMLQDGAGYRLSEQDDIMGTLRKSTTIKDGKVLTNNRFYSNESIKEQRLLTLERMEQETPFSEEIQEDFPAFVQARWLDDRQKVNGNQPPFFWWRNRTRRTARRAKTADKIEKYNHILNERYGIDKFSVLAIEKKHLLIVHLSTGSLLQLREDKFKNGVKITFNQVYDEYRKALLVYGIHAVHGVKTVVLDVIDKSSDNDVEVICECGRHRFTSWRDSVIRGRGCVCCRYTQKADFDW